LCYFGDPFRIPEQHPVESCVSGAGPINDSG
jgi:hypothetical protein